MSQLLRKIEKSNDIKKINNKEYKKLAKEIREFLIENISNTGGHLASNLGVVELTMAIHLVLDLPKDKIIWDVGHQAYIHKILTGRKEKIYTLRQYEGISGFPKISESSSDSFSVGHSSTAISAALGLTKARDIKNDNNIVVAVIGDGALSGGMAYEGLNNAACLKSNMIIILNDNRMSISENVGGVSKYLEKIRINNRYKDGIKDLSTPGNFFDYMGIKYIGPVNGHDINKLLDTLVKAKNINNAVIIHVITKKGKGYKFAEEKPIKYHGVPPFDINTGEVSIKESECTYTTIFSKKICEIATEDEKVVAITAGMSTGTGLKEYKKLFPNRFFDVGIAEEHAVTFAAGLAAGGLKPIVAIYSTFLQRAYDQILHDVCIDKYPVTLAISHAGIVGEDGETHHGVFDLSFLSHMPNMTIIAPKNKLEFEKMLKFCNEFQAPIAIRYPKSKVSTCFNNEAMPIVYGKSELLIKEKDFLIIAIGSAVELSEEVYRELKIKGEYASVINARFVKPFDYPLFDKLINMHHTVVVIEENMYKGGLGEGISAYMAKIGNVNKRIYTFAINDEFIEHGEISILRRNIGLTVNNIIKEIINDV